MPFTAEEVFEMTRSLLNDQIGSVYTNEVVMPYLNIALRDLGSLMERSNIPVTNASSAAIDLPAGTDNIGGDDPSDPDLPEGLVEIQGIYQRQPDAGQDYFMITRYEFLPHINENTPMAYIPAWAWMEQIIKFIPASGDLEIKIDYIKSKITTITDAADSITIIGSQNYLGYQTAALCAFYVGENETRAKVLADQALGEWGNLEGVSTKGRQSIYTRRRPFRQRNWGGSALGW